MCRQPDGNWNAQWASPITQAFEQKAPTRLIYRSLCSSLYIELCSIDGRVEMIVSVCTVVYMNTTSNPVNQLVVLCRSTEYRVYRVNYKTTWWIQIALKNIISGNEEGMRNNLWLKWALCWEVTIFSFKSKLLLKCIMQICFNLRFYVNFGVLVWGLQRGFSMFAKHWESAWVCMLGHCII